MTLIQIILLAVFLLALARAVSGYRKGQLPLTQLAAWMFFWIAAGYVVVRPETTSMLARLLGVGRGADVVVYLALVAAFYLIFRMFAKIEALERQLTKLVRGLALKDMKDESHGRE
jgi:hypothetical protein